MNALTSLPRWLASGTTVVMSSPPTTTIAAPWATDAGANDNASGTAAIVTLAANSDHYPFATHHVPCIFLENEKGDAFQYYHTIFYTYKTVRFDSYEPVFRLVRDFVDQY